MPWARITSTGVAARSLSLRRRANIVLLGHGAEMCGVRFLHSIEWECIYIYIQQVSKETVDTRLGLSCNVLKWGIFFPYFSGNLMSNKSVSIKLSWCLLEHRVPRKNRKVDHLFPR